VNPVFGPKVFLDYPILSHGYKKQRGFQFNEKSSHNVNTLHYSELFVPANKLFLPL
jgi:hypothetical protein